jgi:hypothetical protein
MFGLGKAAELIAATRAEQCAAHWRVKSPWQGMTPASAKCVEGSRFVTKSAVEASNKDALPRITVVSKRQYFT